MQAELDALKKARASGASRLSYDGKSVEYRDDAAMQAAIAALENDIANATGATPVRTILIRSTKGW